MRKTYKVGVHGTATARHRWPIRTYKWRSSARRRRRQIRAVTGGYAYGVDHIYILPWLES
jgi:GrpB-like predicted nucleotidyltransferase (UPF0157 family)